MTTTDPSPVQPRSARVFVAGPDWYLQHQLPSAQHSKIDGYHGRDYDPPALTDETVVGTLTPSLLADELSPLRDNDPRRGVLTRPLNSLHPENSMLGWLMSEQRKTAEEPHRDLPPVI